MVLLFPMKQILILVRAVFAELIYLSGDLKTINCHIKFLDCCLRQRSVPPCYCNYLHTFTHSPLLQYCMGMHSPSIRPVDQQRRQLVVKFYPRWCYVRSGVGVSARRIKFAMNRFYTKQTKIFGPKNFHICFF